MFVKNIFENHPLFLPKHPKINFKLTIKNDLKDFDKIWTLGSQGFENVWKHPLFDKKTFVVKTLKGKATHGLKSVDNSSWTKNSLYGWFLYRLKYVNNILKIELIKVLVLKDLKEKNVRKCILLNFYETVYITEQTPALTPFSLLSLFKIKVG